MKVFLSYNTVGSCLSSFMKSVDKTDEHFMLKRLQYSWLRLDTMRAPQDIFNYE